MDDRVYLIKYLTNTQGQDASSVSVYISDENKSAYEKAIVAYHQALTAFHNASDVLYAVVKIEDGVHGNLMVKEIVDHRRKPTPEPEEE